MSPPKKRVWSHSWAGKEREKTGQMLRSRVKSRLFPRREGKKMRICRLAFITTTGVIMCNYRATAFTEIDERRVWRKNEGINAEACVERKRDQQSAERWMEFARRRMAMS